MSRSLPLTLTILGHKRNDDVDGEPKVQILRELLRHADRWRSVTLSFDRYLWKMVNKEMQHRYRPSKAGYFPSLQRLTVADFRPSHKPIDLFEISPSLSTLIINDLEGSFVLPYSQLKSLDLELKIEYLDVLRQRSNLGTLVMSIRGYKDPGSSTEETVLPPLPTYFALTTLDIRIPDFVFGLSWTFRNLTLPVLQSLFIHCMQPEHVEWPAEDFTEMITRSECTLETLHLDGPLIGMKPGQLRRLFRVVPALVNLKIDNTSAFFTGTVNDELVDLLTIEPGADLIQHVFLPCLLDFGLRTFLDDEVEGRFVCMVKSRQRPTIPGVAALRVLNYSFQRRDFGDDSADAYASVTARIQAP